MTLILTIKLWSTSAVSNDSKLRRLPSKAVLKIRRSANSLRGHRLQPAVFLKVDSTTSVLLEIFKIFRISVP